MSRAGSARPALRSTKSSNVERSVSVGLRRAALARARVAPLSSDEVPRLGVGEVPLDRRAGRHRARRRRVRAQLVEEDLASPRVAGRGQLCFGRGSRARMQRDAALRRARAAGCRSAAGSAAMSSSGRPIARRRASCIARALLEEVLERVAAATRCTTCPSPGSRRRTSSTAAPRGTSSTIASCDRARGPRGTGRRAAARRTRCGAARRARRCACPRGSRAGGRAPRASSRCMCWPGWASVALDR